MKSFHVFQFAEGCKRFRTETMSAPDAKVVLDRAIARFDPDDYPKGGFVQIRVYELESDGKIKYKGEVAFTNLRVKEKQEAM